MGKRITTVNDIKNSIESIVPRELEESWDNSGLLIGFEERQVSRILTCLEITDEVIEEAISVGAQMIITHHPFIFGGLRNIRNSQAKGAFVIRLVRHGISVYSSHTPFDKVDGGNNDALAGLLQLKDVTDLGGNKVVSAEKMLDKPSELHIGRIGKLNTPLKFSQLIDFTCDVLGLKRGQISAVGNFDTVISKVGICTGSGSEFIEAARECGAQAFITGDLKYHAAMDAKEMGMCVIDAGHYGTEQLFGAVMQVQLEKVLDKKIEVIASKADINPFLVL